MRAHGGAVGWGPVGSGTKVGLAWRGPAREIGAVNSTSVPSAAFDAAVVRADEPALPRTRVRAAPFAALIGLSAFLLFTLELLGGRLVLPVFGGSPGVWTTSLCFFTSVLFGGYAYAHLLTTRVAPDRARVVHLVVGAVAVGLTVVAPSDVATLRNPALPEALNVILALAVIAGGPAFLLATTTPLLSSWFAARGGRDPWWLYATSNAASFLALVAYPFLVEPNVPISMQRTLFAVGLIALTTGIGAVAVGMRPAALATVTTPDGGARHLTPAPTVRRQALWLFAAAVPAGLLSATTSFLQTDLVSAPFIWVGPLAVYLASFVVAFSERGRRTLPLVDILVPAAATLLWLPYIQSAGWPIVPLLAVALGSFFVLAVAVHGHLALARPAPEYLTRYYLVQSAGGLLATTFVALVAPLVFPTVLEYPLLIVGALVAIVLLPGVPSTGRGPRPLLALVRRLLPYAAVSVALLALIARSEPAIARTVLGFVVLGAVVVAAAFNPRMLAIATIAVLWAAIVSTAAHPLLRVRTFFGVVEVRGDQFVHQEISGTTVHGVQFMDARRDEPTAYYVPEGPFGEVMADLRARTQGAAIGVVGLGIGTLAAYQRPADDLTFFEIDQAVIDIARDPRWFTYLADAPRRPAVVLGDARLSLRDVPPATFDVLVLDAFSSDSVPAHLLTREAMETYLATLRPGGILLFHVSNRYYDLPPGVASTAETLGLATALRVYFPPPTLAERLQAGPTVVVVAGAASDIERFRDRGWSVPADGPVLSDDYSDLMRLLRLGAL
jgi:SAM-dependent methyltransferase